MTLYPFLLKKTVITLELKHLSLSDHCSFSGHLYSVKGVICSFGKDILRRRLRDSFETNYIIRCSPFSFLSHQYVTIARMEDQGGKNFDLTFLGPPYMRLPVVEF